MRSAITDMLRRRLTGTPVVTDPDGGVRLARPINLPAFVVAYARTMGWPGGEANWRHPRSEEAAARLLLWLDGVEERKEQDSAA